MTMHTGKKVVVALPVLLTGGTEVQTLHLVRVLAGAGCQVTVCCYHEYDERVAEWFRMAGAEVALLGMDRQDGLVALLSRLRRFFRQSRPDVVHVQYLAPGFFPIIAARLAGVPTVFATVHQPGRTYGVKEKLLLRTAARLCTAFFCNSLAVEKSWFGDSALLDPVRLRERRHWTIYNAIDAERIALLADGADSTYLRASLGIGDRPTVGVVGRLRREKGQEVLIDAMTEVVKRVPEVLLLLVGDGPDRESLEEKSRRLGIVDNVLFLGQREPEEVYRLYSIMDLVAVPSLFEGFGLAAAEAMAAGKAVVASGVDGLAEVVADKVTGILIPPGDAVALAEGICTLIRDEAATRIMKTRGRARAKFFSLEQFGNAILQIYKEYPA